MKYNASIRLQDAVTVEVVKINRLRGVKLRWTIAGGETKERWLRVSDALKLSPSWEFEQSA